MDPYLNAEYHVLLHGQKLLLRIPVDIFLFTNPKFLTDHSK